LWILKKILSKPKKKKAGKVSIGKKIAQHIPGLKSSGNVAVQAPAPVIMKKKKKGILRRALGLAPLIIVPIGAALLKPKGKKHKYAQQPVSHAQALPKKQSLPKKLINEALFGSKPAAAAAPVPRVVTPKKKKSKALKLIKLGTVPLLGIGTYLINKTAKKGSKRASDNLEEIPEPVARVPVLVESRAPQRVQQVVVEQVTARPVKKVPPRRIREKPVRITQKSTTVESVEEDY
jgi:hypothetical protein